MYERLLNKNDQPTDEYVKCYLGEHGYSLLSSFESQLNACYHITRVMRFPYGNSYGWGYKYSHKASHLCDAFFESGAFTVMLQLGDKCVARVQELMPSLLPQTRDLWENRYPCGENGGWIHYRVLSGDELSDVIELLKIRKKPRAIAEGQGLLGKSGHRQGA